MQVLLLPNGAPGGTSNWDVNSGTLLPENNALNVSIGAGAVVTEKFTVRGSCLISDGDYQFLQSTGGGIILGYNDGGNQLTELTINSGIIDLRTTDFLNGSTAGIDLRPFLSRFQMYGNDNFTNNNYMLRGQGTGLGLTGTFTNNTSGTVSFFSAGDGISQLSVVNGAAESVLTNTINGVSIGVDDGITQSKGFFCQLTSPGIGIASGGTGGAYTHTFGIGAGAGGEFFWNGLQYFDDQAAAILGGAVAGDVYQTTGAGAAPLNVAGIVMIVQ